MKDLLPGTIIDFDWFSALTIGGNRLLVFQTTEGWSFQEGALLELTSRGANDWVLRLSTDIHYETIDYIVSRDWNGNVKCKSYDEYDWWGLWDDDDDDWFDWRLNAYDQIYDDNGW